MKKGDRDAILKDKSSAIKDIESIGIDEDDGKIQKDP
jgi:hypothetical protein